MDNQIEIKGFVVVNIDCGSISPARAEAFLDRVKENFFNESVRPKDWNYIFLPNRMQGSSVQVFLVNENGEQGQEIQEFISKKLDNHLYTKDIFKTP